VVAEKTANNFRGLLFLPHLVYCKTECNIIERHWGGLRRNWPTFCRVTCLRCLLSFCLPWDKVGWLVFNSSFQHKQAISCLALR